MSAATSPQAYTADTPPSTSSKQKDKVHHTVTACVRCRQRKTRCDPALPRCEPCERSNAHCEYYDSTKNRQVSRTYITSLQETVRRLQDQLQHLEKEEEYAPDHETMARGAGLVKFSKNDESRFLGPSSGIAITRFVMEFAKQQSARRTIKEVVPQDAAEEIKHKFNEESGKPTSKVYPLISSVAAEELPNRGLMDRLLDIYMVKAQYLLPLLHEPTFREDVEAVYNGSDDATLNFQVRLVIAISMQKLDACYAGLADSYYLAALPFFEDAVRKKDLSTLQCYAMMAQYSLLTPTRTAAYWVVGMAAKLAQELGLCDEDTVSKPPDGSMPNFLEVDMRRRIFWIITSMEYGLAHSLGRPSAFGVTVDNLNVKFFELCDDRYISPEGLLPGYRPIMQKCIAIHFLKMRLLQAEIRRTLYLKKRETPVSDKDPWFREMLQRVDEWVRDCPKNDEGSGLSEAWFQGRRNTIIVMMHRPSPQIPSPSYEAAQLCYGAAIFNIKLQLAQVENHLIDISWIFTQAIFMALNTVLWCISFPGLRQLHPLEEVHGHVHDALRAIDLCADRWPGVTSARQLYDNLIRCCLKAYESDKIGESPQSDHASATTNDFSSGISQNTTSPSSTSASLYMAQSPNSMQSNHTPLMQASHAFKNAASFKDHTRRNGHAEAPTSAPQGYTSNVNMNAQLAPTIPPNIHYSLPGFDLEAFQPVGAGMSPWSVPSTTAGYNTAYMTNAPEFNEQSWLGNFGDQYSRYLHQPFSGVPSQMSYLSQQQQVELMESLEQSQLPNISHLANDSHTFYTANLP